MAKKIRILASTIGSILLFVYLFSKTDVGTVSNLLSRLSFTFLAFAIIINFTILVFKTLRFKMLLTQKIPFFELFKITASYNMLSNVMPLKSGELSYLLLTRKKMGLKTGERIVSWAASRIFDFLSLGIFFLITVVVFPSKNPLVVSLKPLLVIAVLLMIIMLFLLIVKGMLVYRFLDIILGKTPFYKTKAVTYALERLRRAVESFSQLEVGVLFKVGIVSMIIWALQTLLLLALFRSVNMRSLTIIQAIITLVFLGFAVLIPLQGIANFGTYETGIAVPLISFGVSQNNAVAYAVAVHTLSLVLLAITGIIPFFLLAAKKNDNKV